MDQTLIRADMVAIIANKTGLDKDVVDKTMLCFIDTVIDELSKDNKIKLNGFGSFENTHMKSRTVSSPLTGRTMEISERVLPFPSVQEPANTPIVTPSRAKKTDIRTAESGETVSSPVR